MDIIEHHLALVGVKAARDVLPDRLIVAADGQGRAREGSVVVHLVRSDDGEPLPGAKARNLDGVGTLTAAAGVSLEGRRLRSFHPVVHFEGPGLVPVVTDAEGRMVWAFRREAAGGLLLIGTDLAADLVLLRQGRPKAARNRPTEAQWGYAGERPTYLFAGLVDEEAPFDRPADWWLWTLRDALVRHGGVIARDVLPQGAAGMVIVTGDDDQAPIEDYRAQRALLGDLPVTYFLHPLCQLGQDGLNEISQERAVEWELHPDALDTPEAYPQRFAEQASWFERLVGRRPRLVRNHGFLNDGYWGHAATWLAHGIVGSSNLPGVDGRVLNGSLLPSRLVLDGRLTSHWSLLTTFGDGAMFIHDWDAQTARDAVLAAGRRIVDSGVPGVLVLNLHPANHVRAAPMHAAARELVALGFAAATLGEALDWFGAAGRCGAADRTG